MGMIADWAIRWEIIFLSGYQSEIKAGEKCFAIPQFLVFSCRKVMKKRGDLCFLFSVLAHWCSYFTGSHLQSAGKMLVFRSCKIKDKWPHSSTSWRFYVHFPLQMPSFALLLGPELLMTCKGYFGERSKLLASSWTNDLHYVLMSLSQKR